MKQSLYYSLVCLLFSVVMFSQSFDYPKQWKAIENNEKEGKFKTNLSLIETIYKQAKKDNRGDELIKAILYKTQIQQLTQENKLENDDIEQEISEIFQQEIEKSKGITRALLQNYYALHLYNYYQNNQWNIKERTDLQEIPKNLKEWTQKTFKTEIQNLYEKSITENKEQVLQTEAKKWKSLLIPDKTDEINPSLYHIFADNYIRFLSENYEFNFSDEEKNRNREKKYELYQTLKNLYQKQQKIDAFLYTSEKEISQKLSDRTLNNQQYINELESLIKQNTSDFSSQLYYKLAFFLKNNNQDYETEDFEENDENDEENITNFAKSHHICEKAIENFPKSKWTINCQNLIKQIEWKTAEITINSVNTESQIIPIGISHRNISKLFVRVYNISSSPEKEFNGNESKAEAKQYSLQAPIVQEFSVNLKEYKDYKSHKTIFKINALSKGEYRIVVSNNENFIKDKTQNFVKSNDFLVTQFAIIYKSERTDQSENINQISTQILNRENGLAKSNITFELYKIAEETKIKNLEKLQSYQTNANGESKFPIFGNNNYYFRKELYYLYFPSEKEFLPLKYFGNNYGYNYNSENDTIWRNKATIFTDRAIYRPSQTLHFKSILYKKLKDKTQVLDKQNVKVELHNVNHEKIAELPLTSNDFGSVFGEFMLPNNGLTGNFYLKIFLEDEQIGYESIRVEEYKRPKFEVTFEDLKGEYKLNETIAMKGFAKAFSGANITDAKVKYRVTREEIFPFPFFDGFRCYFPYRPYQKPEEIAQGELITNDKGEFSVAFLTKIPENFKRDEKYNTPKTYNYIISADVTDLNGETHSQNITLVAGEVPRKLNVSVENKISLQDISSAKASILATNLNNQKANAKGKAKLYKLQAPKRILTPNGFNFVSDYQLFTEQQLQEYFPHISFNSNEKDPTFWKKEKLIIDTEFSCDKDSIRCEFPLSSIQAKGNYVIEMYEVFGKDTIRSVAYFQVYEPKNFKTEDNEFLSYHWEKPIYKKGEIASLIFTSDVNNSVLYYFLDFDDKRTDLQSLTFHGTQATLEIPVTEAMENGAFVNFHFIKFADYVSQKIEIPIVKTIPTLEITTNVIREKLEPGKPETWQLTITGKDKDKVTAELLATMYDASLDQFVSHNFDFNPKAYSYYSRFSNYNFNSFKNVITLYNKGLYNEYYYFSSLEPKTWSLNEFEYYERQRMVKFALPKLVDKVEEIKASQISDENIEVRKVKAIAAATTISDKYEIADQNFNYNNLSSNNLKLEFAESAGQPGSLKIRGNESLDDVENPLYIIDGVVSSEEVMKKLNPNDILSANVIRGTEATNLYGARAANGVVIINTKKGNATSFEDVKIRKNLQETAFFFPNLSTDDKGNIILQFTSPEALTQWKVLLLAHTKDLTIGQKEFYVRTQKELMVVPNPPRFLRENDEISFASKITNLSDNQVEGNAILQIFDAFSGKNIDNLFQNTLNTQHFNIEKGKSTNVVWQLKIPENIGAITYKVIAKTQNFSDGEENALPILTNRTLVTETLPISVREGETKTYQFKKLSENQSNTLQNFNLAIELNTNPLWLAIAALPYLREYPYECSEQLFSRLYANMLSNYILNASPKIKKVLEEWNNKGKLTSKLQQNEELKNILLEETPWLRSAENETEQMKRLALFFELNIMKNELKQTRDKLLARQLSNGAFAWFEGGKEDIYITNHIIAGFGKLKKMTGNSYDELMQNEGKEMLKKAIQFADNEMLKRYKEDKKNKYFSAYSYVQFLYARSFWLKEFPLSSSFSAMKSEVLQELNSDKFSQELQSKALSATVLYRYGKTKEAQQIITNFKETSTETEENGMFWKNNTQGWFWYNAPIETQSAIIEAFAEITPNDNNSIEAMKVWLIKNKKLNGWETTKATTEAVYAMSFLGKSWIDAEQNVQIESALLQKNPSDATLQQSGLIKSSIKGSEITPEMSQVTISQNGAGITLGGLYWQYFEQLDKISSVQGGIIMNKELFLQKNTENGEELQSITENQPIKIGDLVVVRLVIKTDKDMEYIHLKDMRAAGFEPVNVLSSYKWQNGVGYYESTRDAATNFFISYLPKGTYVFEYKVRANNAGNFSNGITTLQNMYAPEMSAHSEGTRVTIKE